MSFDLPLLDWSFDVPLFSWCVNKRIWILVALCPGALCCTSGQAIAYATGKDPFRRCWLAWFCWCIGLTLNRQQIREALQIPQPWCQDFLVHMFCCMFGVCQEYNTVIARKNMNWNPHPMYGVMQKNTLPNDTLQAIQLGKTGRKENPMMSDGEIEIKDQSKVIPDSCQNQMEYQFNFDRKTPLINKRPKSGRFTPLMKQSAQQLTIKPRPILSQQGKRRIRNSLQEVRFTDECIKPHTPGGAVPGMIARLFEKQPRIIAPKPLATKRRTQSINYPSQFRQNYNNAKPMINQKQKEIVDEDAFNPRFYIKKQGTTEELKLLGKDVSRLKRKLKQVTQEGKNPKITIDLDESGARWYDSEKKTQSCKVGNFISPTNSVVYGDDEPGQRQSASFLFQISQANYLKRQKKRKFKSSTRIRDTVKFNARQTY